MSDTEKKRYSVEYFYPGPAYGGIVGVFDDESEAEKVCQAFNREHQGNLIARVFVM